MRRSVKQVFFLDITRYYVYNYSMQLKEVYPWLTRFKNKGDFLEIKSCLFNLIRYNKGGYMRKGNFLSRLPLFSLGCTTIQATQPQPQPMPQPQPLLTHPSVLPRQELLVVILLALAVVIFIVLALKDNEARRKKAKKRK